MKGTNIFRKRSVQRKGQREWKNRDASRQCAIEEKNRFSKKRKYKEREEEKSFDNMKFISLLKSLHFKLVRFWS